jgi:hypothetical protein
MEFGSRRLLSAGVRGLLALLVATTVALWHPVRLSFGLESLRQTDWGEVEAQFSELRPFLPRGARVAWLRVPGPSDRYVDFFQCLGEYALVPAHLSVITTSNCYGGDDLQCELGRFDYLVVFSGSYRHVLSLVHDRFRFIQRANTRSLLLLEKVSQ